MLPEEEDWTTENMMPKRLRAGKEMNGRHGKGLLEVNQPYLPVILEDRRSHWGKQEKIKDKGMGPIRLCNSLVAASRGGGGGGGGGSDIANNHIVKHCISKSDSRNTRFTIF